MVAVVRHQLEECAIHPEHQAITRVTDTSGVLGHRVQNRLEIGRRAADRAEDLGGGGLLLQRLGKLARALLLFFE